MLENLLDARIPFYRDSIEIHRGNIPVSQSYVATFTFDTFFTVTAIADTNVTITLSGDDRSELFNFYAGQTESIQGRTAFRALSGITSTLSATGGTLVIVMSNQYGKPQKAQWLLNTYDCRVVRRELLYPYTPLGETTKPELRAACCATNLVAGDLALYEGSFYNIETVSPISGISGFDHCELVMKRR
jgi:hypothetical protein